LPPGVQIVLSAGPAHCASAGCDTPIDNGASAEAAMSHDARHLTAIASSDAFASQSIFRRSMSYERVAGEHIAAPGGGRAICLCLRSCARNARMLSSPQDHAVGPTVWRLRPLRPGEAATSRAVAHTYKQPSRCLALTLAHGLAARLVARCNVEYCIEVWRERHVRTPTMLRAETPPCRREPCSRDPSQIMS
jgi:hypothetical protein